MSTTPDADRLLVEAALDLVAGCTNVRAAELLGVSEGQVRLWKAGVIRPLLPSTRGSLTRALDPVRLAAAHAREVIGRITGYRREMTKTELRLLHLLQQVIQLDPDVRAAERKRKRG